MVRDPFGWFVVIGIVAVALAFGGGCAVFDNKHALTPDQLSALSHPLEIAVAFCAGYLGLDQFRFHRRIEEIVTHASVAELRSWLITRFKDGGQVNGHETSYLLLLFLAEDEDVRQAAKGREQDLRDNDLYRGADGRALRWLIAQRYDRKVVMVLLFALCFWFTAEPLAEMYGFNINRGVAWLLIELFLAVFISTAIFWYWGDTTMENVRRNARGWKKWIATSMAESAATIRAPELKAQEAPQQARRRKKPAQGQP